MNEADQRQGAGAAVAEAPIGVGDTVRGFEAKVRGGGLADGFGHDAFLPYERVAEADEKGAVRSPSIRPTATGLRHRKAVSVDPNVEG
jgi:hypothetical protein